MGRGFWRAFSTARESPVSFWAYPLLTAPYIRWGKPSEGLTGPLEGLVVLNRCRGRDHSYERGRAAKRSRPNLDARSRLLHRRAGGRYPQPDARPHPADATHRRARGRAGERGG